MQDPARQKPFHCAANTFFLSIYFPMNVILETIMAYVVTEEGRAYSVNGSNDE